MRKAFTLTVLCAAMFVMAGNSELRAQGAGSNYDRTSEAVANQPAPLLKNRTLQDQRNYGINLYYIGAQIFYIAPAAVILLGVPVFSFLPEDLQLIQNDLAAVSVIVAAAGVVGIIGAAVWVAGVIYRNNANDIFARGVVISEYNGTSDLLLALDGEIAGLGLVLRY